MGCMPFCSFTKAFRGLDSCLRKVMFFFEWAFICAYLDLCIGAERTKEKVYLLARNIAVAKWLQKQHCIRNFNQRPINTS